MPVSFKATVGTSSGGDNNNKKKINNTNATTTATANNNNKKKTSANQNWTMLERLLHFDPRSVGLGGLDEQFLRVLRNTCLQTAIPQDLQDETKINMPAGILLYGPPGTGKTSIARAIHDRITDDLFLTDSDGNEQEGNDDGNANDKKQQKQTQGKKKKKEAMITTPADIFNGVVGSSEANIKKLFAPVREAAQKFKASRIDGSDNTSIQRNFVIIMDEIDGICPIRTINQGGGDGVPTDNKVISTLLSEMDGLYNDENVRVILVGMTNRPQAIDPAMLRSGRLSEQIYVPPPTFFGRFEIFRLKLQHLIDTHHFVLEDDNNDDLMRLAAETNQFTGADIAEVVRRATLDWLYQEIPSIVQIQHDMPLPGELRLAPPQQEQQQRNEQQQRLQYHRRPHVLYRAGCWKHNDHTSTRPTRKPQMIGIRWCPRADTFLNNSFNTSTNMSDVQARRLQLEQSLQQDLESFYNDDQSGVVSLLREKYPSFMDVVQAFEENAMQFVGVSPFHDKNSSTSSVVVHDYDDDDEDADDDDDDESGGKTGRRRRRRRSRFSTLRLTMANLLKAIDELKIIKNIPIHSKFAQRKPLCERHARECWAPVQAMFKKTESWYRFFVSVMIQATPGTGRTNMIRSILHSSSNFQIESLDVGLERSHSFRENHRSLQTSLEERILRAEKSNTATLLIIDGLDFTIETATSTAQLDFLYTLDHFLSGARYADGAIRLFFPLVIVVLTNLPPTTISNPSSSSFTGTTITNIHANSILFEEKFDFFLSLDLTLDSVDEILEACRVMQDEYYVLASFTEQEAKVLHATYPKCTARMLLKEATHIAHNTITSTSGGTSNSGVDSMTNTTITTTTTTTTTPIIESNDDLNLV